MSNCAIDFCVREAYRHGMVLLFGSILPPSGDNLPPSLLQRSVRCRSAPSPFPPLRIPSFIFPPFPRSPFLFLGAPGERGSITLLSSGLDVCCTQQSRANMSATSYPFFLSVRHGLCTLFFLAHLFFLFGIYLPFIARFRSSMVDLMGSHT